MATADSCMATDSRRHFFLTCFDWILPFCNFFRKFGNLVAGFLTMRLSFFAITCSPLNQDVLLPSPWTVEPRARLPRPPPVPIERSGTCSEPLYPEPR
jgi:hypothetical protein